MKRILALAAALALLAGCAGPGKPARLLQLEQEQGVTALWRWEKGDAVRKELSPTDAAALAERLNSMKITPDPHAPAATGTLYGVSIDQGGYDFLAVVSAGTWLDSAGGRYTLEEDFQSVWDAFEGTQTEQELKDFPNIRALAQSGDGWNISFMEPARMDFPTVESLSMSLSQYDPEKKELQVRVENNDLTTWCTGRSFRFQVLVDGAWYEVPYLTADHISLPSESIDITRFLPQTVFVDLSPYGDLPAGTYRLVKTMSNIFGLAPDASVVLHLEFA